MTSIQNFERQRNIARLFKSALDPEIICIKLHAFTRQIIVRFLTHSLIIITSASYT